MNPIIRAAFAVVIAWAVLGSQAAEAENIGSTSESLVSNQVVGTATQERYTLVRLNIQKGPGSFYSCSGSLLRNDWVVTAAHCVEVMANNGLPNVAGDSVSVEADWTKTQTSTSDQVYTFRPNDVALIHLAKPLSVNGMTDGFNRLIFQSNQFPYFGVTDGVAFVQFGRGINRFAHMEGNTPVMSSTDGQYRVGYFQFDHNTDYETLAWFNSTGTNSVAGGDSGGPAFASVLSGDALVGVLAASNVTCLEGQDCSTAWNWVTGVTDAADAPLGPVLPSLDAVMGPFIPHQDPPQNSYVGTFGTLQYLAPMWVYGVDGAGTLQWYRKDSASAPWQGPRPVGWGWGSFRDIIPAGGYAMYGLTSDGHLVWYRHDGFSDGSFAWTGPVTEGNGWSFQKVFCGGAGILYAIKTDGTLLWYDNPGYASGQALFQGARVVGYGWNQFRDIFSSGQGTIYAITTDGKLLQYQHKGYANGDFVWSGPLTMGGGFDQYSKVIAAGNGILLAFKSDGTLYSYKFKGDDHNPQPLVPVGRGFTAKVPTYWDGPTLIGSGWQDMETVFAMLPAPAQVPR